MEQQLQKTQNLQPCQNQQGKKRARLRLRESCNSCAVSKVKCSRDQPNCERCIDRGIYCTYSPSRRTGKRRASTARPIPPTSIGQQQVPPGLITPSEDSYPCDIENFLDFEDGSHLASGNFELQYLADPKDGMRNATLNDTISDPWSDPSFASIMGNVTDGARTELYLSRFSSPQNGMSKVNDCSHPEGGYMLHSAKSSTASSSGETVLSEGYNTDATRKEQIPNADTFEGYFKSRFDILAEGVGSAGSDDSTAERYLHCTLKSIANPSSSTDSPRDCMTIALDALQSLHRPQPTCTSVSECCSTRPSQKAQTLEIDDVLAKNKEIMDAVTKTLKCPCSLDTQLALILTCIGFKIIAWYSAVVRSEEEHDESSSTSDTPVAVRPAAERVSHMPIMVGKYHFHGDDRVRMLAQMALGELHRVVRLIEHLGQTFKGVGTMDSFNAVDCGDDTDSESRETRAVTSFIGPVLVSFLRDRVRFATQETMGILNKSQQIS